MKQRRTLQLPFWFGLFALGGLAFGVAPVVSHGQTQNEMHRDAMADFKKADATMNAAYQKLMSAIGKDKQHKLKAAQQAWLKFRDAESAFLSSNSVGGSVYPTLLVGNRTTLMQQRTEGLNQAYKLLTTEGEM